MIEANEFYVINELKEIGVNNSQIRQFLKRFRGWRIYFRKKKNEYEEIKTLYSQMQNNGIKKSETIKYLATIFEKSEGRIREIIREQKGLFDE